MFSPNRRSEALERLAAINDATAARVEAAADIVLGPAGPAKMDDTTECLAVPRAAVGRVIGKRGATIKGIERDSGCREAGPPLVVYSKSLCANLISFIGLN